MEIETKQYLKSPRLSVLGLLSTLSSPISSRGRLSPVSVSWLSSPLSLSGFSSSLVKVGTLLVLGLLCWLFRVSVEVQIWHNSPWLFSVQKGTSESQDFSSEQPPDQTSGVLSLVVTWNSNIDVLSWRVAVDQSDHWDVDVRRFFDSLSIGSWVCHDD
ncbi:hypothetical protein OGAPHI_000113 [Ogataea philodendri]|uniref:Uncharacterized protein n=1 Tax=Ogataea philodendri TaxID=1378263 RepID=A0A9P8PH22_9ASCO|nr:uncharacterized protein OGAPHI_000113 [Ogataea philodendri]KAH3671927.1 hypothetical protein OGAPHI_000113 [Ogataea philodendri]